MNGDIKVHKMSTSRQ